MGGGDLNSKKSWHPNTMKNQERVWKAEQLATEEKKRIAELQKERAEERDREELNALANQNRMASTSDGEVRLSWMYDKPDKKVQAEDYLLGKSVDSKTDGPSREEGIPTVFRRVAGVSLVGGAADVQVDLVRKMREDPLLLVQERERAARAALLNNPIQRKKLTELLRQDQEKKQSKPKVSKSKDIDNLLASKLNALGGQNGVDLAALLASDDSSEDTSSVSSSERRKKKKKNQKSKKKTKLKHREQDDSSDNKHKAEKKIEKLSSYKKHKLTEDDKPDNERKRRDLNKYKSPEVTDSHTPEYRDRREDRRRKSPATRERREVHESRRRSSPEGGQRRRSPPRDRRREEPLRKKSRMTSEERAARLAEMVRAGADNESRRGERVAAQRDEPEAVAVAGTRPTHAHGRMLPTSLEARIQSNRHNIQRNKTHMNEHFARR